ncbi:MAG: hypothetical protein KF773_15115 [Deltaproteobacteria bacterium]|nr:hypothetical protein [Deltaproteobacteria bacterium]MCW5802102.1 hypothetical protein [Deltaproteobacteria bacterium]
MRWVLLAALAGCSFSRTDGTAVDAPPGDAPAVDAVEVARCRVRPAAAGTEQPSVGGPGGGGRPELVCPTGELPIGASFDTSVNTLGMGFNFQQAVVSVHIRCGAIARTKLNVMATTPSGELTRAGTTCAGATSSSGEKLCPAGAVLVAIRGNASGGQFSSLNSVQLECAALAPDGSITGMRTTLDFRPDTGNYTNDQRTSSCPTGTAIVAFGGKAGCTQDQLSAKCAPLTCD